MAGNSKIASSWSDLPKELVEKIANYFDTETDVLRFRAICSPWRSATTPFKKLNPASIKLPFPVAAAPYPKHDGSYFTLTERTVYRVQPPDCKSVPNFWLVKTEASNDGKLRILNPLNDRQIKILPEKIMPKVLNTLDFRVSEVCKSYALKYVNPADPSLIYCRKFDKKVAVSFSAKSGEYAVMLIDDNNKLWYKKSGEEDKYWTIVPANYENTFRDIINYKGQFRGLDYAGCTWYFNSMLESTKESYFRFLAASKRHFVEVSDELFLIEEVTDKDKRVCTCYDIDDGCHCSYSRTPVKNTAVEIVISRTDITRGGEWVDSKDTIAKLMGKVIFVGDDCSFSVPVEGVKGPLVFYTDQHIYFRTEEEKKRYVYDDGMDGDCGYGYDDDDSDGGYNHFECDCCVSSDDESTRTDSFVPSDDVKVKFRGLHGHNSGVYDFQSGKLGSLLMFPEYANVFWPPPAWLNRS